MIEFALFLAGAVVSWFVQHWYSKGSEKQLREIADKADQQFRETQRQLQALAQVDEDRGFVEWTRKDGQITFGRIIRIAASDNIALKLDEAVASLKSQPATMSGTGEVIPK